jgi:2-polyprenyl-3-methyl-5-hydroxy-6-metoxy-1,4-benzoquinol methylase
MEAMLGSRSKPINPTSSVGIVSYPKKTKLFLFNRNLPVNSNLESYRMLAAEVTRGTSAEPVYNLVLRICRQRGLRGKVLDYGSGIGTLPGILHSAFPEAEMWAADILPRPPELQQEIGWIQGDLNNPLPAPDASFDAIMSSEVIEHLENPRAMFRDLFRLLKPGGLLVVTTPNQESLRSLAALLTAGHFAYFSDNCYPAHITALLSKDFQRIAKEAGFGPAEFQFSDVGGIPKVPTVKWQAILPLLKGRWFSDNIAAICIKP